MSGLADLKLKGGFGIRLGKLGSTPTPWSGPFRDHGLNPPPSTVNPMHEGFSVSGAPVFGFGLAGPAPKG